MKFRILLFCSLFGLLWVLLAADTRCIAFEEETPLPAASELTRQLPVKVADAYDLRALLARLSLEAGDTVALDRTMQDLGHGSSSRDGLSDKREREAAGALSAIDRCVPDGGDLVFLLRKIRI